MKTKETKFGEYEVTAEIFSAKSYQQFIQKTVWVVLVQVISFLQIMVVYIQFIPRMMQVVLLHLDIIIHQVDKDI
jgi:hypothetical protein